MTIKHLFELNTMNKLNYYKTKKYVVNECILTEKLFAIQLKILLFFFKSKGAPSSRHLCAHIYLYNLEINNYLTTLAYKVLHKRIQQNNKTTNGYTDKHSIGRTVKQIYDVPHKQANTPK